MPPSNPERVLPKISVLMSVFNGARFLAEAIQSILDQTFTDFEFIIVDDGSTDGTPQILSEFAGRDSRIRVLTKENSGISDALNKGLALCQGTYVARMDADDIALPRRLAEQARILDDDPGVVLVGGLARGMDEQGKVGAIVTGGRHLRTNLRMFPPKVAVAIHPLIMVRRAVLVSIGGYRTFFNFAEDYDLFLRLAPFGRFARPEQVMLFYRRHQNTMSFKSAFLQERLSALAEISAIEVDRGRADPAIDGAASGDVETEARLLNCIDADLFDAYVRFRVWRRTNSPAARAPEFSLRRVLGDALSVRPTTVFSKQYAYLRYRILAGIVRVGTLGMVHKLTGRRKRARAA